MVSLRSAGVGQLSWYSPSDEMEAPESLKSSEPIWMGNTFPEGKTSGPPRDSAMRLGADTSMTRPCGPVPLLGSFRLCVSLFDWDVFSRVAGAVMDEVRGAGGRASEAVAVAVEVAITGEVAEVIDEARDLDCRFEGCSPGCQFGPWAMPELGSESAFLFMPVCTERRWEGRGGGDSGFCTTAGAGSALVTGSGMLKSVAGACWAWSSCTSSPWGSYWGVKLVKSIAFPQSHAIGAPGSKPSPPGNCGAVTSG